MKVQKTINSQAISVQKQHTSKDTLARTTDVSGLSRIHKESKLWCLSAKGRTCFSYTPDKPWSQLFEGFVVLINIKAMDNKGEVKGSAIISKYSAILTEWCGKYIMADWSAVQKSSCKRKKKESESKRTFYSTWSNASSIFQAFS